MDGYLPYRFTGKELDEETGLYYYGQRYLDPQYNIWMTSDPAIYDYMSQSKNGEGGIYNITNLNLYHYAGNNPIKYTDPDGRSPQPEVMTSAGAVAVSTEAIAVQGIENFVGKSPILIGIFFILFLLNVCSIRKNLNSNRTECRKSGKMINFKCKQNKGKP